MNYSIELSHPEATPIARGFSVACVDGVVTYFSNLIPFERHDENDKQARAFIMARLRVDSNLPVNSIAKALNVSRSTVMQHCKNYREFGRAWFFKARKQRRRSAIDSATKEQAESLLAQGVSASQAASQLNVARATLTENIRAGKIKKPGSKLRSSSETQDASHRTERDVRDQSASMGDGRQPMLLDARWHLQGLWRRLRRVSTRVLMRLSAGVCWPLCRCCSKKGF